MAKATKSAKRFAQQRKGGGGGGGKGGGGGGGGKRRAAANDPSAPPAPAQDKKPKRARLEDMGVDEFLDGGFMAGMDSDQPSKQDASDSDSDSDDDAGLSPSSSDDGDDQQDDNPSASASESESDGEADDDQAAAKGDATALDNKRQRSAVKRHARELEQLKERDPEFYAYLAATDEGLLGFGGEEDDNGGGDSGSEESGSEEESEEESGSEESESEEDEGPGKKAAKAASSDEDEEGDDEGADASGRNAALNVTTAMVDKWCEEAGRTASVPALKRLLRAYRAACHYADEAKASAAGGGGAKAQQQQQERLLRLSSPAALNRALLFTLREADGLLRRCAGDLPADLHGADVLALRAGTYQSGGGGNSGGGGGGGGGKKSGGNKTGADAALCSRWKKVEPLAKSFLGNTLHLLGSVTDPAVLAYALRRLRASAAMLAPFEKLTRRTVRAAAAAFGSDTASASDAAPSTDPSGAPRVQALLLLRACMLLLPSPTPETALRSAYRAYVQNAKFVSAASVAHLGFMAAGLVELVGAASPDDAYTCAFGAVRELALLARTALAAQKADSFREVYCWQTVNCLELWARVLAAHCGVGAAAAGGNGNNAATPKTAGTKTRPPQKSLAPLVYPLTQVLLVAARLVPTPRYFPLRLRLCRALSRLAQATGFYVPLSAALVEMLEWAELRRKPAGASSKNKGKGAASKNAARAPDMMLQLRLSKASLRSPALQEEVVAQVVEALSDHLSQWSTSVAFPELSVVPVAALRKFVKRCPVERFRKSVKGLADALERNAAWVGSARDAVSFAPHDLASAGAFLAGSEARAPLAQYAAPLLRKAAARMALRSALPGAAADGGAVAALVGGGGSRSERRAALNEDRDEEGDDDDEDEDEMEARAAAAAKRAKGGVVVVGGGAKKKADEAAAAARKAGGERESSDDEEDGAKRGGGAFAEGDEDEVGDYELSESGDEEDDDEDEPMEEEEEDEEEEEAPRPARGGGGRGGGGRGRGGGGRGRGRGRGPRR